MPGSSAFDGFKDDNVLRTVRVYQPFSQLVRKVQRVVFPEMEALLAVVRGICFVCPSISNHIHIVALLTAQSKRVDLVHAP